MVSPVPFAASLNPFVVSLSNHEPEPATPHIGVILGAAGNPESA
jgi:hypothetical protein